jgi:hypothetical protein
VTDAGIPESIVAAWQRVLSSWDDPASHDELFRLVAQHNCFAWAAARYKTRDGDPIAAERLAKLRRATEAVLRATAMPRSVAAPSPLRKVAIVVALFAVAIAIALVSAYVLRGKHRSNDDDGRIVPAQPAAP